MLTSFRKSLGARGILFFCLCLLVILTGMTSLNVFYQKYLLKKIAIEHSREVANLIVTSMRYPMLSGDQDVIQKQFDAYRSLPEIVVVHLTDSKGVIKRSTDHSLIGGKPMIPALEGALLGRKYHAIELRLRTKEAVVTQLIPILNEPKCYSCHSSQVKVLGVVRLALDWEETKRSLEANTVWNILLSIVGLIIMSLLIAVFFLKIVVSPIRNLEMGMKKVSQGELNLKLPVGAKDEIGNLTILFNNMTRDFKALIEKELELNSSLKKEVSERKKAEHDLRRTYQNLMDIVEFLPDAAFVLDKDKKVIAWNKVIEAMTGVPKNDIIGKGDYEYSIPFYGERRPILIDLVFEDIESFKDKYKSITKDNRKLSAEMYMPGAYKGKGAFFEMAATPLFDEEGEVVGAVETIRDITERKEAEEALRTSKQIIEGIINSIPVRVFWKDRNLVYLGCNAIFAADAGFADPVDLIGKDDYQMAWRDQAELYRKDDFQVISSGQAKLLIEEPQTTPQGKTSILLTSKQPLRDSKGEIIGVLGTYLDITERKMMEEELRRTRQNLMDIIEFLPDAAFVIDKNKKVIAWNKAIEDMTGVKKNDIIGKGDFEYSIPFYGERRPALIDLVFEDPELFKEKYKKVIKEKEKLSAESYVPGIYRGRGAFLAGVATPLFDEKGNVVGAIETIRDITESKKAEEALAESEKRFMDVMYASKDAILLIDGNVFVDCNESTALMLGYANKKDFLMTHPSKLSPPVQPDGKNSFEKAEEMIKVASEKGFNRFEWMHRKANGEDFPVEVSLTPIALHGRNVIYCVWHDISLRKKAEAQLKQVQAQLVQSAKMASVGQLAGGVAHEINNPLTGILNNVQLIKMLAEQKKEFNLDDFKDLLKIIEESAVRCAGITRALLDFSRASRNSKENISFNEIIEKICALTENELKMSNITIRKELEPGLPVVSGDIPLLQQVVFDIISNAKWAISRKEGNPGGTITIKTEHDVQEHAVYVSISDTGIGIPKENLERILEPFFTTKPVGEGTGLGLAIVYSIIKDHKGGIEVKSEPGQGASFKISLPYV